MAVPTLTPMGIRTDLVSRLTGKTGAGSNVFDSRRVGLDETDIPAVTVYSPGHSDENKSLGQPTFFRSETVGITAVVTGSSDAGLAAAVDTIEGQILNTLLTDLEWTGAVTLEKVTSKKEVTVEGKRRVGFVALRLEVAYNPTYAVDLTGFEFERIAIETDSTDPDKADVSERVIELETED